MTTNVRYILMKTYLIKVVDIDKEKNQLINPFR